MKSNIQLLLMVITSLAFQACLLNPGTGEEPPNFINNGGEGTGGGSDSTSQCLLSVYKNSPSGLVAMVNSFVPTTIYGLEFAAGASGAAYIQVSVQLGDYKEQATGCSLIIQFYRSSSDSTGAKISVGVTDDDVTAGFVQTGELFLPSIGLTGGTLVDASVVAYLDGCPNQGSKTSNLLQGFYAN